MILLITFLPAVCRSWSFAHPHWHLPLSLLENGHSNRGRMIARCSFEYVSMMVSDIEDFPSLSCWSFVFLISAAVYWGSLTISQMGCLGFWIFQVVDIFWMSILHPTWNMFPHSLGCHFTLLFPLMCRNFWVWYNHDSSFVACALWILSKSHHLHQGWDIFPLYFLPANL